MIQLSFSNGRPEALQVLCLGSHSDDIEIGCGGTILRLADQYPASTFHWVVFNATGVRASEAKQAANLFVRPAQLQGPLLRSFDDGFMPFMGAEVKAVFEELKQTVSPHLIFTHNRKDAHQDHRLIAELTWNTFRNHLILEYEVPKYDGDIGQPSIFVPLTREHCEKKVRYVIDTFKSQQCKRWFEKETLFALMRLRGMECNADSGYAEAFYCKKLML